LLPCHQIFIFSGYNALPQTSLRELKALPRSRSWNLEVLILRGERRRKRERKGREKRKGEK